MNNKKIIIITSLILGIALIALGFVYFLRKGKNTPITIVGIHETSGLATKNDNNSIWVSAQINGKDRLIKFNLTPQTVVTKTLRIITEEQLKSDKPYKPETRTVSGDIQEIKTSTRITKVKSKEDLTNLDQATATEINYITYSLPSNLK